MTTMILFRSAKLLLTAFFPVLLFITLFSSSSFSQYRDYMTEAEIEIVRDAQIIDERVAVIVKMIDRRFEVLQIESNSPKNRKIDGLKWEAAPTGTKAQLVDDINKLLNKAVDDIDNVVESGHSPLAPAKDMDKLLPRAIKHLDAACKRYLPLLKVLLDRSEDERERGSILQAIEISEEVIEAAKKM